MKEGVGMENMKQQRNVRLLPFLPYGICSKYATALTGKVHYSPVRSDLQHSVQDKSEYNFLVSKADVWAHEHEWRLICETEEEYLPFDCVSKVFLGVNFDKEMKSYQEAVCILI